MNIVYGIYLSTLIFAPLAIGTRALWSRTIMEFLCLSGFILFFVFAKKETKTIFKVPGTIPLIILILFMLFQIVPLPGELVKLISPYAFKIHNNAAIFADETIWCTLSINPKATLTELYRFISYACFYFLTVQLLTDKKRLKTTLLIVAILAGIIAVYALIETFCSNGKIYWIFEIPKNNNHIGPYVYHNHFAGYMEMMFPVVFALFYYYKPVVRYNTIKDTIVDLFTLTGTNIHILLGFAALLMVTSVFVSLSRGGIISLSISMIGFTILMMVKANVDKNNLRYTMFLMFVVLSVSWFGWDLIFVRFEDAIFSENNMLNGRSVFWKDSLAIIKDFPLTGSGFGSFEAVYPSYSSFAGDRVVDHAHNDYVELLATSGVTGFIIISSFLTFILMHTYRVINKRRDEFSIYLSIGAFSGIIAILIHSFSDFNFYNGANGLYFFFITGLLITVSNIRVRSKKRTHLIRYRNRGILLVCFPAILVLISCLNFNIGSMKGLYHFAKIKDVNLTDSIKSENIKELRAVGIAAVNSDPLEEEYHLAVAAISEFLKENETAKQHYINAVNLNPLHGEILQRFGRFLFRTGEQERAEKLYQAGVDSQKMSLERAKYYVAFLLHNRKKYEGLELIKKVLRSAEIKKDITDFISMMAYYGISGEEMESVMPERVIPRNLLADYLYKSGKDKLAEKVEASALYYIKNEPKVYLSFFTRHYKRKIKAEDFEGALSIILDAMIYLPDDFWLHVKAGDVYKKLGINYRAIEEYQKAIALKPDNTHVRVRLEKIMGFSG